jgi:hypothetical protein
MMDHSHKTAMARKGPYAPAKSSPEGSAGRLTTNRRELL